MTTIPQRVLDLLTFNGFYELYISMTKYCDTCKMAYESAEKEYKNEYGMFKFRSYKSFLTQVFYELYISLTIRFDSCKDAYEATEKEYYILYGNNRYSSYESFRAAMSQNMKNKKSNNVNINNSFC